VGHDVPVIARVECRSEGTGEQRPVAVWLGGTRIAVAEVLDDAIHGSAVAGGVHRRHLVVRLVDGRSLTLEREAPQGEWRVYR
jgi:hypothetical protein